MKTITRYHYDNKPRHKWAGADELIVGDIVTLTSPLAWMVSGVFEDTKWLPLGPSDIMIVIDVQTKSSGSHVTVMHNGNIMTRLFTGSRSLEYMFERVDMI